MEIFASFLRSHHEYQRFFQICRDCHGQARYVKAEVLFHYEHGSPHKIGCHSHDKLIEEVSDEDLTAYPWPGRVHCSELEEFFEHSKPDMTTEQGRAAVRDFLAGVIPDSDLLVEKLAHFTHTEPRLPDTKKDFVSVEPIRVEVGQSREEIIECVRAARQSNSTADLAFYAYRDIGSCNWEPFVKAAMERNPVSIETTKDMSIDEVYSWLAGMPAESIYDGGRLAQPDEVANYATGDGLEKALLLADVIHNREPQHDINFAVKKDSVLLDNGRQYKFESGKGLSHGLLIAGGATTGVSR